MIAIHINKRPIAVAGKNIPPFQAFECQASTVAKFARNRHFYEAEDFKAKVRTLSRPQLQQMCKNAGLPYTGNTSDLKHQLKGLADLPVGNESAPEKEPAPEVPSPVGDVDTDEMQAELLEMTVNDLRKMASDFEIPGYANVRKAELVELILDAMQGDDEQ